MQYKVDVDPLSALESPEIILKQSKCVTARQARVNMVVGMLV